MPAGVFLLGDEETKGVKSRVRRLIAFASADWHPASSRDEFKSLLVWGPASLFLVALVVAASSPFLLSQVHYVIEHAVVILR